MNWNRLSYARLLVLACFASGCAESVGPCVGALQGRDTVLVAGEVVYGGQAIMNAACATGCHSSTASGEARRGVPAGLDFDLRLVDEEDTAGTKKSGGGTVVKLKGAQVAGLRQRQAKIVEFRNSIWHQVEAGLMPPGGLFETFMSNIYASSEKKPCQEGKPFSSMESAQSREVLRNWLACGAPFVETNSAKVTKSRAAGQAGYQYRACTMEPEEVVTLETLFKYTLSDCKNCHNSALTGPPFFTSVEVLAEELRKESKCGGKPFVTPGKLKDSYMLDTLKGPNESCGHSRMPKGGEPLSEASMAQIEAWILAGAPTTMDDVERPSDDDDATDTEDESVNDGDDDDSSDPSDDDDSSGAEEERKDAGRGKDAGKDAGRDAGKRDAGR